MCKPRLLLTALIWLLVVLMLFVALVEIPHRHADVLAFLSGVMDNLVELQSAAVVCEIRVEIQIVVMNMLWMCATVLRDVVQVVKVLNVFDSKKVYWSVRHDVPLSHCMCRHVVHVPENCGLELVRV